MIECQLDDPSRRFPPAVVFPVEVSCLLFVFLLSRTLFEALRIEPGLVIRHTPGMMGIAADFTVDSEQPVLRPKIRRAES